MRTSSGNKRIYTAIAISSALFIALMAGLILWKNNKKRNRTRPMATQYSKSHYDGIDVSHYQGNIDWRQIADNPKIRFVYIKATDGIKGTDKKYRTNVNGAHKAKKLVGAYHFLSSKRSIRKQFDDFRNTVKRSDIDLIPMLDIEIVYDRRTGKEKYGVTGWTNKQLRDSTQLFVNLCKEHYGKAPIIYSAQKFYKYRLSPQYDRYLLCIARYSKSQPVLQNTNANIWQYSETGRVKGIKGNVDLCRLINGTTTSQLLLE